MDTALFSDHYTVRRLTIEEIPTVYALCRENDLYYQYCPPLVTEQSSMRDMQALPPGKGMDDKYYVGYYDGDELAAVMDLIAAYPDEKTMFIGFFMTAVQVQNQGVGSRMIQDLCDFLKSIGYTGVRLGWVKGNPQAEHFWHKNGFREMGITYDTDLYTVIIAQRCL